MINSAFAQAAQTAPQGGQQSPLMAFMPFIIIFIIFYFLMIRPQKKKMQQEKLMLASLAKGDEIFTKAGIIGTITGLTDKVISLEISEGVKMQILRSEIGGSTKNIFAGKEEKK